MRSSVRLRSTLGGITLTVQVCRRCAIGAILLLISTLSACGSSSATREATPTTSASIPPTTIVPSTTTTEPVVFGSPAGHVLKQFGYNASQAETLLARANDLQTSHPSSPVLSTVVGTDELRLVDLPFHQTGAETLAGYIDNVIATGYTVDLDMEAIGHASFKSQARHVTYQTTLVLPADRSIPVPPDWLGDLGPCAGSSHGYTRFYGSTALTVIELDQTKPIPNQAYQMAALEAKERLVRNETLSLLQIAGPVSVSNAALQMAALEVDFNWRGRIVGEKVTGASLAQAQSFINGMSGAGGNLLNVTGLPMNTKLPPFDPAVWASAPGTEAKPWG